MIQKRTKSLKRRGWAAAAATLTVTILLGSTQPAFAWGTTTVTAPYGCTGQGYGSSSGGGFVYSETIENGNFCWPGYFQNVEAGLWRSGGAPVFVLSRAGFASVSGTNGTGAGTFYGGYHRWGGGSFT